MIKPVRITMMAAYNFKDIKFDERALQDGVKECKWRVRETWKNLSEVTQKTTQSKTVELLLRILDDIRNISLEGAEEGREGV